MPVRAVVQRGPKGKRSVAFALDWPGWARGARTPDLALALLEDYRRRYLPVAAAVGRAHELEGPLEVVEDVVGSPSTDFWGISFAPSALEREPVDAAALERGTALLRACWDRFDATVARVSAELRKGPRGGGRDRDEVVGHVLRVERLDFAKRVGLRLPEDEPPATDHRDDYVAAMRAYNAGEGKRMRSWNLPFLLRHTAFHVMDHAWELEDKDLTAPPPD